MMTNLLTITMLADGPIASDGSSVASSLMSEGISIAISGLTIVFMALLMISLFIASLPHLLRFVAKYLPEVEDRHSVQADHPESLVPEDGAALAAIGYVLHTEMQRQLAAEHASKAKG